MLLGLAAAVAFVFYIMAIVFGLQSDLAFSGRAFTYLGLAVVSSIVAVILYRRYTKLRQARWQDEIKASEEKMRQLLAQEAKEVEPDVEP